MSRAPSFYHTDGNVGAAPCYVERSADKQLFDLLTEGRLCYVLTSRQMGKSSLMARCRRRLQHEGIIVAVLDFSAFGQTVTPEQWYNALALRLGEETGLEDEIELFWRTHETLGPVHRFFTGLREVILDHLPAKQLAEPLDQPASEGPSKERRELVVFIDELDMVRGLPFSTDEFFATIRACHEGRGDDPLLQGLTFCLLGVATPSELIRDSRNTPFNIGSRIELNDFTQEEAAALAQGLNREAAVAGRLMRRIYSWTQGHPYLTQNLCKAVAEQSAITEPEEVDRLCHELFLCSAAREKDSNLLFVRERILRTGADVAGLLTLYDRVRRNPRRVKDPTNPLVSALRLSGIIRLRDRRCEVRNPIYARAFDRAWVRTHMPDAELRRQRQAYWRGVFWSGGLAAIIVTLLTLLISYAFEQSHLAREAQATLEVANQAILRINDRLARTVRRLHWQTAEELLAAGKAEEALPYLARFLRDETNNYEIASRALSVLGQNNFLLPMAPPLWHRTRVLIAQFSPDGTIVATGLSDGTVHLWNARTAEHLLEIQAHQDPVNALHFSRDGTLLISSSADRTAAIWRVPSGELVARLRHDRQVIAASFSPDNTMVATGAGDRLARLWNVRSGQLLLSVRHGLEVSSVQFSPDGRSVLSSSDQTNALLWSAASGQIERTFAGHTRRVRAARFSPDGDLIATASDDQTAKVFEVKSGTILADIKHKGAVRTAVFSRDGARVLTAADDQTARIFDARTGAPLVAPLRHLGRVAQAHFSEDGQRVVTACLDGTARLWNARDGEPLSQPFRHGDAVVTAQFSPGGETILTGSWDGTARLWEILPNQELILSLSHAGEIRFAEFSPHGELIVTASADMTVKFWNPLTGLPLRENGLPHSARITQARFSPDGRYVVTGTADNRAQVWEVATGNRTGPSMAHPGPVVIASFSWDGRKILTGSRNIAQIWTREPGASPLLLRNHSDDLQDAEFSADGKWVVTASSDQTARWWDAATGEQIAQIEHAGEVNCAAFSSDGRYIASGSSDHLALIWDTSGRKVVAKLPHHGAVRALEFSPDGQTLATVSADKAMRLWKVPSGQLLAEPSLHAGSVGCLQFSPDGRNLVTGSDDHTARIWDARTGHPLSEPLKCDGIVWMARFSPDGHWVVIASSDRLARLWETPAKIEPVPSWLPEMLEAVAGQRFNSENFLQPFLATNLFLLKSRILQSSSTDAYTRWAQWYFADRTNRTISPLAHVRTEEYIARKVMAGTMASLTEASPWPFQKGIVFARLARELLKQRQNPSKEIEADWYSLQGVNLSPETSEVWAVRARCLAKLNRPAEAFKMVERALELKRDDAGAIFLRGQLYFGEKQWQKASDDFTRSLALDSSNLEAIRLIEESRARLRAGR